MKAVLIPVKDPGQGKTRLAGLLTMDERRRLAWAMFKDVLRAAASASTPDRIVVVTSFTEAAERARELGVDILMESAQISESASVDWASGALKERGFNLVMRLPADVPLIRPEDIDEVLSSELSSPGAVLVPSRDGTGTNAIIRTPPDVFASRFGPNSLELHKQEAERAGAGCEIVGNERIGLDIDEPNDLDLFLELGHGTEAFQFLSTIVRLRNKRSLANEPA